MKTVAVNTFKNACQYTQKKALNMCPDLFLCDLIARLKDYYVFHVRTTIFFALLTQGD